MAHRLIGLGLIALAGCATDDRIPTRSAMTPAEAKALIAKSLPPNTSDRSGWSTDIYAALEAMQIAANIPNICAAIAVTEQESSFRANPAVPGMAAIAWREIDAKAERAGVPKLVVHTALKLTSSNGKSYSERIDAATTEKDLSDVFEDFIDIVPMGKKLFAGWNPVRTAGPMQVSIAYAEKQVATRPYPYEQKSNIRAEVFTRRGGLYFGIAHLLDYPASYDKLVYRFADFNAGHYASRNAAFQNAVSQASGVPLELDGDLIDHGPDSSKHTGSTELATRLLGKRIGLDDAAIRAALEQEGGLQFEKTSLYQKVFALADQKSGAALPRAVLPQIKLKSPKITRSLTTEWFANRVDERHQRCMTRAKPEASG
jgi:Protein of unknown function (DUF1615)